VNDEALGLVKSQLGHGCAAVLMRTQVAVELLRGWCSVLLPQESSRATEMIRFIALQATTHSSSGSHYNVGGRSMEVLRMLAEHRPEFRAGVSEAVVPAILSKVHAKEFWKGLAEALKVAQLYLEVFNSTSIHAITRGILALLRDVDPARGPWVIVQPALDFLSQAEVRDATKDEVAIAPDDKGANIDVPSPAPDGGRREACAAQMTYIATILHNSLH
jgi:hypothetical protein